MSTSSCSPTAPPCTNADPPLTWDLTALLNAADPQATLAERNLWLVRLLEWLRHAPREVRREGGEQRVGEDVAGREQRQMR